MINQVGENFLTGISIPETVGKGSGFHLAERCQTQTFYKKTAPYFLSVQIENKYLVPVPF
jgi:hypothetical protein